MRKSLLPTLLGALIGVALVFLYERPAPDREALLEVSSHASPEPSSVVAGDAAQGAPFARGQSGIATFPTGESAVRAAASAAEAVRDALSKGLPSEQRAALVRVALAAAETDAVAALAAAALIPSFEMRDAYRAAIYAAWGRRDPGAMLAFVAQNPLERFPSARFFVGAAETDAGLVLAMLPRLQGTARGQAERAAIAARAAMLEELAVEAPAAAVNALAEGTRRDDALVRAVARGYARNDLAGALAWLHSLPARSPSAIAAAVASSAAADPDAAADALVDELMRAEHADIPVANVVTALTGASESMLSGFAERLASAGNARVRAALQPFLDAWLSSGSEAGRMWVLGNIRRVPETSIENILRTQAGRDIAAARRMVDDLPSDLRVVGIRAAAPILARTDFAEAVRWVATLRGQPNFDEALEGLLSGLTVENVTALTNAGSPVFAPLLAEESALLTARLAPIAAMLLARSDAGAAARWVLDLDLGAEHTGRRAAAIRNVARTWVSRDAAGAAEWSLSLPRGRDRDEALRIVVPRAASRGVAAERLLDAFASAAIREESLLDAVAALASTDAAAARRLIDRQITAPELRKRAETRLVEGAAAWGTSSQISPSEFER